MPVSGTFTRMGILVSGAVMASAIFILGSGGANAQTRFVATTGSNTSNNCLTQASPCATPAFAYTQASPGDTIQLATGSYGDQNFQFRAGMGGNTVIVKAATGANVTFNDVDVNASNIDFQFNGTKSAPGNATAHSFNVGTTGATRQSNVIVEGVNVDAQDTGDLDAMVVKNVDGFTLRNSRVGNTMAGSGANNSAKSLETGQGGTDFATNVTLEDNYFHDADTPTGSAAHLECLYLSGVQGLTARRNRFENCAYFDMFITVILVNGQAQPKDYLIEDNVMGAPVGPDGADFGYSISVHTDVTPNNFIYRRNTIEGAIETANGGGAISNGWTIDSNIIAKGIYLETSQAQGCRTGITVTNNVMPNTCGTSTTTATEASIRAGWADPTNENFHLTPASAANNVGNPAWASTPDYDGVLRGLTPDAGALEFVTDSVPPTAPTSLSATGVSGAVNLSWTAATDNVGVTGYKVYRSTSTGFTPGAGNLLATIGALTSYGDSTATPGTQYFYKVTAIDASANQSSASNEANGTASSGSSPGNANLWVDTTAGTCQRQAVAGGYVDAQSCSTLDAAFDAANASDVVRIKNGTYGGQALSGTKTGVTFIGESVTGVTFSNAVGLVNNTELDDVTITNDSHQFSPLDISSTSNVTLKNVRAEGDYVAQVVRGVSNFQWIGGRLGDFDGSIQLRHCSGSPTPDSEPLWIGAAGGGSTITNTALIEGLTFSDAQPSENGQNGCSGDNFHLELIRVDGNSNNVTLRRNYIPANGSNSGTIFFSDFEGGPPDNVKIVGNVIGDAPSVNIKAIPGGGSMTCPNWVVAYNTFPVGSYGSWDCASYAGSRWAGNLGPRPGGNTPDCSSVTWLANVTQSAFGDTSCGGTWRQGTDFQTTQLGLTSEWHLAAGSPAINAGELPSATDICTDTSIMGTRGDIEGDPRPSGGTKCDAGADEFLGG